MQYLTEQAKTNIKDKNTLGEDDLLPETGGLIAEDPDVRGNTDDSDDVDDADDPGSTEKLDGKRELTIAEEIEALTDPSFMTSLARGLAVVRSFSDQRRSLTIAQISHRTGIPRAAVRRCLYTLKQLGYADSEANNYFLKPKILTLGYSY
ncbi:helix-turn-helix domain-containing protein, partial [Lacisediminimonas sp.]|uniref:helix-turn-helix domain-containing protein n=1 Tax=Lacisediminimonas sp. TaxID=3060582 RepID=UPI002715E989